MKSRHIRANVPTYVRTHIYIYRNIRAWLLSYNSLVACFPSISSAHFPGIRCEGLFDTHPCVPGDGEKTSWWEKRLYVCVMVDVLEVFLPVRNEHTVVAIMISWHDSRTVSTPILPGDIALRESSTWQCWNVLVYSCDKFILTQLQKWDINNLCSNTSSKWDINNLCSNTSSRISGI